MFGKTPDKKEIAKGVIELVFETYEQEINTLREDYIKTSEELEEVKEQLESALSRTQYLETELKIVREKLKTKKPAKKK